MRKVLSLLLVSIFTVGLAMANPVNKEKARVAALNVYINYAPESIKDYSITKELTTEKNGMATFYTFVFNAGGFVMISADDAAIPVLAYSHNSPYREDITHPAVKEWFDGYSNQIESIRTKKLSNEVTLAAWNDVLNNRFPKDEKAVAPLLTTTWGQGGVFDNYVPAGTPVGCVATAMAQIMNFWEYPTKGSNWHSYTHPTYGEQIAHFFATTYDWANMPDNVGSDASAILSYHLGVAVNMNYSTSGSGAFTQDATYVLANYFKYDQGIDYLTKENFSDVEWSALLTFELDNSRPVLYSGSSTASGGHAFVCDGYDNGGRFHFNWGWDGALDSYYAIGSLNPGGDDFNSTNSIVYRIQPAEENEINFNWVQKDANYPVTSTYSGYIDAVNNEVAWAIGRDGSGNNADFKVYSVTKDGGATWTSQTLNYGTAFSMIDGVSADVAFIAAYGSGSGNKIVRTTDGGENWEEVLSGGGASSFFNVVHFFDENNGFVQGDPLGGEYELYTTTDGGANWTRVPGENIPNPESVAADDAEYGIVGMYDAVGDMIWFTTNNGYIYKSTDKGYTWTKHLIAAGSETNIEIAFDETGTIGLANYFMSNNYSKYKTTDGGETWTELTYTGDFYDSGLSFVPGTESMWVSVGSDYETPKMGVSYTTDGGATWQQYSNYYKNFQITGLDMASINRGYAGTFQGEVGGGMWVLGGFTPDFSANETQICEGSSVTFSGLSLSMAETIEWNFGEGATPASSTDNGPIEVTYSTLGTKTITLTFTIDGTEYTETKVDYIEVVDCTSISETDENQFEIYPNPSNGLFNISSESAGNVTVVNAVGQVVFEKAVNQQDFVDLKGFESGVYFVQFKNENKVSTQRIVIQ